MSESLAVAVGFVPASPPAERLLEKLLRSSSEGLLLSRFDTGVILEVSDALVAITGYSRDEMVGRSSINFELVPPAVREQAIAALRKNGSLRALATQMRAKSGALRDVEFSSDVVHHAGTAYLLSTVRDVTEEHRARREMRDIRDRFMTVFEANPVPTIICRVADGTVMHANRAALELFGCATLDLVGRRTADIAGWAWPDERHAAMIAQLLAGGRALDHELPIRRLTGEARDALASAELLELDGEQCAITIFADVTERKRAEAELRAAEERYRDLFENAVGAIFHASVDGDLLEVNNAFAELLGYESPEHLKAEVHGVRALYCDERDREGLLATLRTHRLTVKGFEVRLRRRQGDVVWVALDVSPITDAHGHIVALREAAIDVTAAKLAQQALRESEAEFRLLAANSTDVISRQRPDGTLLYVSPACRRLFGYEPEELVGHTAVEFLHPDDRADLEARGSRQSVTADLTQTFVFRQRRKDGEYVWVEATVRGVGDPETGELVELQASARDISERVWASEEVRAAKERAERANDAKSRFLSHISHDLRTPLAAILGFAELLQVSEGVVQEEHREWLVHILQSGRHLLELVNQLLETASIEAGKLVLALAPVDAALAVRETLKLVAPLAAERGLRLENEGGVPAAEPFVLADALRLKQVLLNLVSNAIKYNRPGGLVAVAVENTGRESVRITVRDTGPGIAPDHLERLFTPFERLDAPAGQVGGTGLGLVIAKGIVEAMAGTLAFASEVGTGTIATVELPCAPAPAAPLAAPQGPPPAQAVVRREVLSIEDNPVNNELIEAVLTGMRPNLVLRTACTGAEGTRLALERPPDLILLDLNLPDISGEDILLRLRACDETANVPVLVLTADTAPRARLLERGADAFLTKPLDVGRFLETLDRLLAAPGGQQPSR